MAKNFKIKVVYVNIQQYNVRMNTKVPNKNSMFSRETRFHTVTYI